jgi:hypothetical protein
MIAKLQTIEVPRAPASKYAAPPKEATPQPRASFREEIKQSLQAAQDQNPYYKHDTKDKIKVISEKLKSKVSSKIDEYLENRRQKKEA